MKKYTLLLMASALAIASAGCGNNDSAKPENENEKNVLNNTKEILEKVKDGTYTGTSSPDNRGGIGKLTVTIKDHKIADVQFEGIQKDGTVKGEDYGKTNGEIENKAFYNKAQAAVKANGEYAQALLQKQEISKVDGISGATISYKQFLEAAQDAFEKMK